MMLTRIILAFLFLSTNLSAMVEQGLTEVKLHLPSSNLLADEYAATISKIINERGPENIINYRDFVSLLKEESLTNRAFDELYRIATKDKYDHDLKVKYLSNDADFMDKQVGKFLFHGTKATLDVLDTGYLKAYESMSGWGIFFGQNFDTSYDYAAKERSSNIHKTYIKGLVKSVLVLYKAPSKDFIRETGSNVEEYVLREETYSLDYLKDIVFIAEADLAMFQSYLTEQDIANKNKFSKINIYLDDYIPIKNRAVFNEFKQLLSENVEIFNNVKFLKFIIKKSDHKTNIGSLIKKLIALSEKNLSWDNTSIYLALKNEFSDIAMGLLRLISPDSLARIITSKNRVTSPYDSPLTQAVINGEDEFITKMFEKLPEDDYSILAESIKFKSIKEALKNNQTATIQLLGKYLGGFPTVVKAIAKATIETKEEIQALPIILSIIKQSPDALILGDYGDNSLIEELFEKSFFRIIQQIAQIAPDVLRHKFGPKEHSALQLAVQNKNKADFATFSLLFEAILDTANYTDRDQNNIAHEIAKSQNPEMIGLVIKRAPELFTKPNRDGDTPVHVAAHYNGEFFSTIAKNFPQTLSMRNAANRTPAAEASIGGNDKALDYIIKNQPQTIIEDMVNVVQPLARNRSQFLIRLAKSFPQQHKLIYDKAKEQSRFVHSADAKAFQELLKELEALGK